MFRFGSTAPSTETMPPACYFEVYIRTYCCSTLSPAFYHKEIYMVVVVAIHPLYHRKFVRLLVKVLIM